MFLNSFSFTKKITTFFLEFLSKSNPNEDFGFLKSRKYAFGGSLIRMSKNSILIFLTSINIRNPYHKFFYNKIKHGGIKLNLQKGSICQRLQSALPYRIRWPGKVIFLFYQSVYVGSKGKQLYAIKIYGYGITKEEGFKREVEFL